MSEGLTKRDIERRIAEDEARLAAMKDEDIDYSDIPPIRDWSGAVRGKFYRPVKEQVTLRIDADLLAWFRQHEDKYQTAINSALREHVERQRQAKRDLATSKA
jgi:uncharacterized protein (DUF4415 family)